MECPQSHNLLMALDESENSRRALEYVSLWAACTEAVQVTLVHVIKEPSPDVLPDQDEREEYVGKKEEAGRALLARMEEGLESRGVPGSRIGSNLLSCRPPDTIVDAILEETRSGDYDTIVLGRRGMSKKEEYIFGSVTNRIVREVSKISVWVVA